MNSHIGLELCDDYHSYLFSPFFQIIFHHFGPTMDVGWMAAYSDF